MEPFIIDDEKVKNQDFFRLFRLIFLPHLERDDERGSSYRGSLAKSTWSFSVARWREKKKIKLPLVAYETQQWLVTWMAFEQPSRRVAMSTPSRKTMRFKGLLFALLTEQTLGLREAAEAGDVMSFE